MIGSPASIAAMAAAAYIKEKSSSPRPIAADTIAGGVNWYWISAKPSARSSSSATYCGAMQMPAFFAKRMVVISGGFSWVNESRAPMRLAAPTDESVVRKRRRLCVECITCFLSLEVS